MRSVDDGVWDAMMKRHAYGYTLPAYTDRLAAGLKTPKKGSTAPPEQKPLPTPMPDNMVKKGRQGETRAQLLAKPDWLPVDVRLHPRVYLDPPAPSNTQHRRDNFLTSENRNALPEPTKKRSHDTMSSDASPFFPGLPFARPPWSAAQGNCLQSAIDWETGQWTHHYQNGGKVVMLASESTNNRPPPRNHIMLRGNRRQPAIQDGPHDKKARTEDKTPSVADPPTKAPTAMDLDTSATTDALTTGFASMAAAENKSIFGAGYKSSEEESD